MIMFRTCHANAQPFTDFVWQFQLDEMKGLDIGKTYINEKAAKTFCHYMAEVERRKIGDCMKC